MSRNFISIFLVLSVFIAACSREDSKNPPPQDGGQHGGGGDAMVSSSQAVVAAIHKALKVVRDTSFGDNVMYQFAEQYRGDAQMMANMFGGRVVEAVTGFNEACYLNFHINQEYNKGIQCPKREDLKTHLGNLLEKTTIEIKMTGTCPHGKDAYVLKRGARASICFSVTGLRRISPSALMQEILALLMHEVMHLKGFGEDDAVKAQQEFSRYYGERYGGEANFVHKLPLAQSFFRAAVGKKISELAAAENEREIYATLGALYADLSWVIVGSRNMRMQQLLTGELNLNAVTAFRTSAFQVVRRIKPFVACEDSFLWNQSEGSATDIDPCVEIPSKEIFLKLGEELDLDLEILGQNLMSVASASGKWTCAAFPSDEAGRALIVRSSLFNFPIEETCENP